MKLQDSLSLHLFNTFGITNLILIDFCMTRTIPFFILLTGLCFTTAVKAQSNAKEKQQYNSYYTNSNVDSMASYPGGQDSLFDSFEKGIFVSTSLYKEIGEENKVSVLSFIVDSYGNINTVEIAQTSCFNCSYIERELIRILKEHAPWKPAYKDGQPVTSRIYLPVHYAVREGQFMVVNNGPETVVGKSNKTGPLKLLIVVAAIIVFIVVTR
jgi:hypothetical protein